MYNYICGKNSLKVPTWDARNTCPPLSILKDLSSWNAWLWQWGRFRARTLCVMSYGVRGFFQQKSIEILPCPGWFPGTCFIFFLLFPLIEKQNVRSSELGEISDNLVPPWFCPWASNRPDGVPPLMMVLKREGSWNWVKLRMLVNSTNISWVITLAYQPRGRETGATLKPGEMAGSLIRERVWKKSMEGEREHRGQWRKARSWVLVAPGRVLEALSPER